jgi:hypothetical protein
MINAKFRTLQVRISTYLMRTAKFRKLQMYANFTRKILEKMTIMKKIIVEFDSGQDSSFDNNSMLNIKPKK